MPLSYILVLTNNVYREAEDKGFNCKIDDLHQNYQIVKEQKVIEPEDDRLTQFVPLKKYQEMVDLCNGKILPN